MGWQIVGWSGVLSLVVGLVAGLYVLVMIALPTRMSGIVGKRRAIGFGVWLFLAVLYVAAVGMSLLHSIGHNSAPPLDRALPYYIALIIVAAAQLIYAIKLHRQRKAFKASHR